MDHRSQQATLDTAGRVAAAALPDAWAIYVHGSMARGDASASSDIDLAVLLPPGSTIPDKLGLMARVAAATGRDADIVDLRQANLDLVHALLLEGCQLLVRREEETLAWEAERMTDYGLFNPRRADIVEQYMREPRRHSP